MVAAAQLVVRGEAKQSREVEQRPVRGTRPEAGETAASAGGGRGSLVLSYALTGGVSARKLKYFEPHAVLHQTA